ncbi:MAG: methyltransferase domain-containing protein [Ignavibacteriales bacterium]|nr:methyltransferase domain-containing protein [Ignavibacteriales bacterium]
MKIFKILYNSHWFQKKWTKRTLKRNSLDYSYIWGNPEKNEDTFGNYLKIKDDFLLPNIKDKVVLELGCLDGKWSQYIMPHSREAILVDLDKSIIPLLDKRLKNKNYIFYETKGFELKGIANKSVDFIFSMDTLVRVKKKYIKKYFIEFERIMNNNGKILVHLPCNESRISRDRGFTNLSEQEIMSILKRAGFKNILLDYDTIVHGVLVLAGV